MTEYTLNGATVALNSISESYQHFAKSFNEPNESKESVVSDSDSGTPSVLDQATKGL